VGKRHGNSHRRGTKPLSGDMLDFDFWEAWLLHIVTYDLKSPNDKPEDYQRVIGALKLAYSTWCHMEKSVWLVSSEQSASEVRDTLKEVLRPTDTLFVARLSGNWATFNVGEKRGAWLKKRSF
jgi:hypothetical protein